MEGNLNNNEVNNNQLPNNNYYEPKKNGVKILLIVIIILLLLVGIGLLSYKVFVLDKKDLKEERTSEKIRYEVKAENNLKYLYVNDRKVANLEGTDIKVKELKNVLVVEWLGETVYSNGVVYVTGDGIANEFKYLDNSYGTKLPNNRLSEYKVLEDSVEFVVTRDDGFDNSTGWMCETNEIAKYTKTYKYLGGGKFDNGTITNEVTVKEAYPNTDGCNSEKVESLSINSAEAKKYYGYVNSNNESGTVDAYNYNRLNEYKNYNAYAKLIVPSSLKEEKCSKYASYIEQISPNPEFVHRCLTFDDDGSGCSSEYNKRADTKVVVLEDKTLKEAVELIYGKGSYVAGKFAIGGLDYFEYVDNESKYILLTACGGGTGPSYISKLVKAEKNSKNLYIYEELTDNADKFDTSVTGNRKLVVKHTFEKNTYDNNYHYVKSEKGE